MDLNIFIVGLITELFGHCWLTARQARVIDHNAGLMFINRL